MKHVLLVFLAIVLCSTALPASQEQDPAWVWVLGELPDASEQAKYVAFSGRIYDYYQGRGSLTGERVGQAELTELPSSHTVLIGPLPAFEHKRWFGSDLEVTEKGGFRLAGMEFDLPDTGIFLRSEDELRVIYTGLSRHGWEGIFKTPTGQKDCTIIVGGRPCYEGDWEDGVLKLHTREFMTRYPSEEELEELNGAEDVLKASNVYDRPGGKVLSSTFTKGIEDLVRDKRLLFVGENHWNVGVNQLFNRIAQHLLVHKTPSMVFLEFNFSFSAHCNHYVTLEDDRDAALFLREKLHPLISAGTEIELLDILRCWNREHPEQKVQVGSLDMEWGMGKTLKHVVTPFFAALEPACAVAGIEQLGEERWCKEELVRLRARLAQVAVAPKSLPFLTPEFIGKVLINLENTLNLGSNPMVARQAHIVRNIVDFHGEHLEAGFALFKGGGYHAQKSAPMENGVYRDAAYLHQVHGSTKGRVASLYLHGLGYRFTKLVGLDMRTRISSATNYRNLVKGFQRGLLNGTAAKDGVYLLNNGTLQPLERLMARVGYDRKRDVLWLESSNSSEIEAKFGMGEAEQGKKLYDAEVFVMRSYLEPTRPLVCPSNK
ncbi:MAG: erythromycin esterase family protein [bacterium]|nr:erythromycin esterase family protein [bacterium]